MDTFKPKVCRSISRRLKPRISSAFRQGRSKSIASTALVRRSERLAVGSSTRRPTLSLGQRLKPRLPRQTPVADQDQQEGSLRRFSKTMLQAGATGGRLGRRRSLSATV
jgi:hypothetical protein